MTISNNSIKSSTNGCVGQVEGRKRWRVYPPASDDAALPRLSSPNLTDEQAGEPALEVVLEPGDLLYFPRLATCTACDRSDRHDAFVAYVESVSFV